jgi:hypothetical protein
LRPALNGTNRCHGDGAMKVTKILITGYKRKE